MHVEVVLFRPELSGKLLVEMGIEMYFGVQFNFSVSPIYTRAELDRAVQCITVNNFYRIIE